MKNASSSSTDLESFGVSQNGEKLREALLSTRFRSFTGDFSIDDNGQLHESNFEIINVNGNGERGIGFWTSKNGIIWDFGNSTNTSTHSTSKNNLGPIIWHGETSSVPKGWEIPTNGKKLRIGVLVMDGFCEFVNIKYDLSANTTEVTGYSIDVFKAVVDALPYGVQYEFISFAKSNGESAGTYNDLIYHVYSGGFDAVVGDTTIIANRSNYVDFTFPYTESGVSMIVPVKDNRRKNAWVFLKPLALDLWVTSACSFIFIGFVIWVLDHRINDDFRGRPSHQIGASFFLLHNGVCTSYHHFYFNKQKQGLALSDTSWPIKHKVEAASFNHYYFTFVMRISRSINCIYRKGSENGGIAAAFDEIPYMRLFLGTYCSKYTMVEPTYKTDGFGFGFVFPVGSPLVPDMSRAILNVTEGDKMRETEDAWFKKKVSCPDLMSSSVSANSLGLNSFWGLFLIAGVASVSALFVFAIRFLYERRHIFLRYNPSTSIWRRVAILFRIFNHKDLSSHTFRKSEMQNKSDITSARGLSAVETSPSTHYPPSPSSQTESNFLFYGDQGIPSAEFGEAIINPYGEALEDRELNIELAIPPARIITTNSEVAHTNN
ncbi:Glutamate receptor [Quillaja saponaria]|uniref:Glutamate receptor n=1 Tax=Quillaja saponaria TaxID=32244 RepID=A0AAD7LHU0_QUISA|nr:Glutamate receptor [Quillaja saponaria]